MLFHSSGIIKFKNQTGTQKSMRALPMAPIESKTEKEICALCGGDISKFFAAYHDNICEKCWYDINKFNTEVPVHKNP